MTEFLKQLTFKDPYSIPDLKNINRQPTQAIFVDKLREAVFKWRKNNYEGVTDITRILLNYWFYRDHLVDGRTFKYFFCQREAIETLIYLYEVRKAFKFKDLKPFFTSKEQDTQTSLELFKKEIEQDQNGEDFPKYCFKMATGSGKTKVMSLAIVWAYLNCYVSNFLILAPNVIVFERLKEDFGNGNIFLKDPLIPEEFKDLFSLQYIMRGDPPSNIKENSLILLNIDQIRGLKDKDEEVIFGRGYLAPRPNQDIKINDETYFKAIKKLKSLMIINDEAHHVHDPELAWSRKISEIHNTIKENNNKGIMVQLDFSATPKYQASGQLFKHIIVDYPLADAIDNGIVKRVIVGEVSNAKEDKSQAKVTKRFKAWLDAGVERWKEYKDIYEKEGKKTVIFVMTEDTNSVEEDFEYLDKIPILNGRVLLIHTDKFNNISTKDEDKLREAAKNIDNNEYYAIVSVMMLKEGWDVKNVTVALGLRAYSSKANILPEQTIGRGLRRMDGPGNRDETLDIIGNDNFLSIVNELSKEGVSLIRKKLDTDHVSDINIEVDKSKMDFDIKIPVISPKYYSKEKNVLESLKVEDIKKPEVKLSLNKSGEKQKLIYKGWDARKLDEDKKKGIKSKEEFKREYNFIFIKNSVDAINFFTNIILKNAKLPYGPNFKILASVFRDYVEDILFEERVDLDNPIVIDKLNEEEVQDFLILVFAEAIKNAAKVQKEPYNEKKHYLSLLDTKPFIWDKNKTFESNKTIFNLVVFDNNFEKKFIELLELDNEIKAFAKLVPWKMDFRLEYFGKYGGMRHYYPDFVAESKDGTKYLLETKGETEGFYDEDVNNKTARAIEWCRDVSEIFGEKWDYVLIPQKIFEKSLWNASLKNLINTIKSQSETLFVEKAAEKEEEFKK